MDDIPTLQSDFDPLRLLFTLTCSLRNQTEFGEQKQPVTNELLRVFVTKSDLVYVHPESVVLKPVWVQMKK